MKKLYALLAGALLTVSVTVNGQSTPRVVLFEEFTGENCNPCAGANPYVKRFSDLNATDSFIHMAYQVPIPSAGPIFNSYKIDANARLNYYNVDFAPWGENDGLNYPVQGPTTGTNSVQNNVYYYFDTTSVNGFNTAAAGVTPISPGFNQRRAIKSPCGITITHTYSAAYDSIYATAIVNTTDSFHASAHQTLKFRIALVENQLTYLNAPGTNGETEFYQVVRKMLPSAAGTVLADSLTPGRADTFHFALKIPAYVREKSQLRFIGFVQDDVSKEVKQSGISKLISTPGLVELRAEKDSVPGFSCTSTSTSSIPAFVTVKNTGSVAITSLYVDVQAGGTSLNSFTYSTPIPVGGSAVINAGPVAVPVGTGYPIVSIILSQPNGINNFVVSIFDTIKTQTQVFGTTYVAPLQQSFEDTTVYPANYEYTAAEQDPFISNEIAPAIWLPSYLFQEYWDNYYTALNKSFLGTEGTYNSIYFWFYVDSGAVGDYYLQKANFTDSTKAQLTFWHADRGYGDASSQTNDSLQVQVSVDCGTTWTGVWTRSGTTLNTVAAAKASDYFGYHPTAANQWVSDTVNLNAYAGQDNVWIRFHAVSDWGDNLWIDQINLTASSVASPNVGIHQLTNVNSVSVYPVPATDNVSLELGVTEQSTFAITVINTLGETVKTVANSEFAAGDHKMDVNTSDLASGIYNFVITSNNQKTLKRFVVAH